MTEWISVKDRFPIPNKKVLCRYIGGVDGISLISLTWDPVFGWNNMDFPSRYIISHWMEEPLPPEDV